MLRHPRTQTPLRAALAALAALVAPVRAQAGDIARHLPPPGAPYVAEEIRVRSPQGYSLGGTLTLGSRGVQPGGFILRHPAVLLIGDEGPRDRDGVTLADSTAPRGRVARPLYDIADVLSRRGIATLRLDDPGVGASTGACDAVTPFSRSDDVRAALEYLRRRPEVDAARIALLGMGEGATLATLVASIEPEVRGLVLMGGAGVGARETGARPAAAQAVQAPPAQAPAAVDSSSALGLGDSAATAITTPAVAPPAALPVPAAPVTPRAPRTIDDSADHFATYDPLATARMVAAPALVMQGDADDVVPAGSATRLAEALRVNATDVTVKMLPGLTHGFMPAAPATTDDDAVRLPDSACGPAAEWLVLHLGSPVLAKAPARVASRRHAHRRRH